MVAKRGMAVFGMKSVGGSGEMIAQGALTPTEALTFAMSLPGVSTRLAAWILCGCLTRIWRFYATSSHFLKIKFPRCAATQSNLMMVVTSSLK